MSVGMLQEISEAIVQSVAPGECVDKYYPGHENTEKSCFPSYVENRFNLAFPSLNAGSASILTFNPTEGVGDIVLTFQFPTTGTSGAAYTGLALPMGWGYRLIREIQVRPASGSQYTFTGDQLYLANLSDAEDSVKLNQIPFLGGQACVAAGDFTNQDKLTAYVYLKLPWNTLSAQEKTLPWPSDLVSQPLTIQIQLDTFDRVFYVNPNVVGPSPYPNSLSYANANFRQTHMTNTGNLLTRRENMVAKALAWPLRYFQQTTFRAQVPITSGVATIQQLNLTGLRSGQLKSIDVWCVRASDVASGNGHNWFAPQDVRLLISGTVYYDSVKGSNQMWSLVDRKTPAAVTTYVASPNGTTNTNTDAVQISAPWLNIPLGQGSEVLRGETEIVGGLNVANSVMNLYLTLPAVTAASADYWFVNVSYNYLSAMIFNAGNVDYVF
jgi:hypothetical protein